ncbi:hypothetical protein ACFFRR_001517 [Megaselia abdita]
MFSLTTQRLYGFQNAFRIPILVSEQDTIVRTMKSKPIATTNGTGIPLPIWTSSNGKEFICLGNESELSTNFSQISSTFESSFETALKTFKRHFDNQKCLKYVISEYSDPKALIYTLQIATVICKEPPLTCVVINDLLFPKNIKLDKAVRRYGTDAVRIYLLSMISLSKDYNFQEIKVFKTNIITPIIKSFKILKRFLSWSEKITGTPYQYSENLNTDFQEFLEKYLLSSIESFKISMTREMEKFRVHIMIRKIEKFSNNFHTALQKLSSQKNRCLNTAFQVFLEFLKITCIFLPFTTEAIFQKLKVYLSVEFKSIHDSKVSKIKTSLRDKKIDISTERLFRILAMVHKIRKRMNIPLRYQLPNLWIVIKDYKYYEELIEHVPFIAKDINVENVKITTNRRQFRIAMKAKPISRKLERRFDLHLKEINRFVENLSDNDMNLFSNTGEVKYLDFPIFLSDVIFSYSIPEEMDKTFQTESDSEFVVILNTSRKEEDIEMDMMIELVKAISKIENQLEFTANFGVDCVMDHEFLEKVTKHRDFISKSIKGKLVLSENVTFDINFEYEETVTIGNSQILVVIYKINKD